ncbi:MAG: maleylpyruvate isomerase N-terminal domain-containing protein [Bryobacterales bacterium]|nr:maleylpyruvate isomerase N-terminal domain-containing protein [Bryobacterales bacterium]
MPSRERIDVLPLLPGLQEELLRLLEGLNPGDWARPNVCLGWTVKDIAAHLLDGDLRKLSLCRDAWDVALDAPIGWDRDLVAFLNGLNASWVTAARRLSPRVLTGLLRVAGEEVLAYYETLDPDAPARFPVAWAGDTVSSNWFDLAREYTERWHHQQQIRDAVGAPGLTDGVWMGPLLATLLQAVPAAYEDVAAAGGASVAITIHGPGGGHWGLAHDRGTWRLGAESPAAPQAALSLSSDTAWRLLTKGLTAGQAQARITVSGDSRLCLPFFSALAVMA